MSTDNGNKSYTPGLHADDATPNFVKIEQIDKASEGLAVAEATTAARMPIIDAKNAYRMRS
ncbi:hypothetical protein K3495_g6054 [Podosphaera aphanis]|nr:hypothetical protein K3495_g6054 [Podosphaera aphanis]